VIEQVEQPVNAAAECAGGGGDAGGGVGGADQADGDVAQGRHDPRGGAGADLRAVLIEGGDGVLVASLATRPSECARSPALPAATGHFIEMPRTAIAAHDLGEPQT